MSKEDLNDYVEIALSFRMVCKYSSKISIKNYSFRLFRNIGNLFNIFVMLQNQFYHQIIKHQLLILLYLSLLQPMLLMN